MTTFLRDVALELARADAEHDRYHSYHEAYGVMLEELDEFWEIVRQKSADRDDNEAYKELVQIAMVAWRSALSLMPSR